MHRGEQYIPVDYRIYRYAIFLRKKKICANFPDFSRESFISQKDSYYQRQFSHNQRNQNTAKLKTVAHQFDNHSTGRHVLSNPLR